MRWAGAWLVRAALFKLLPTHPTTHPSTPTTHRPTDPLVTHLDKLLKILPVQALLSLGCRHPYSVRAEGCFARPREVRELSTALGPLCTVGPQAAACCVPASEQLCLRRTTRQLLSWGPKLQCSFPLNLGMYMSPKWRLHRPDTSPTPPDHLVTSSYSPRAT